jgi:hypothetical protein
MRRFFRGLLTSFRFGKASRLQAAGDYQRAFELYSSIRSILAARPSTDASDLSLRLMDLARLAEVSFQLGQTDMAKSALEEWVDVRDAECREHPDFATVPVLVEWEKWVRATLAKMDASSSQR